MGKLRVGGQPGLRCRLVSRKGTFVVPVENRRVTLDIVLSQDFPQVLSITQGWGLGP